MKNPITEKTNVPPASVDNLLNGTKTGSRFAVLEDGELAIDSDEIHPPQDSMPTANIVPKSGSSSAADRTILKTSLQAAAALANKSNPKTKSTSKKTPINVSQSPASPLAIYEPQIATNETSNMAGTKATTLLFASKPATIHP